MVPGHLGQLRQDMAGADGVAADAVLGEFHRHGPGQSHHAALGSTIDGTATQHALVIVRADVDNAAALPLVHLPGHRLAHEKQALQIGIHDAVIGGLLHIQKPFPLVDACHVEQHIDLAVGLHHFIHAGLDAVQIRDVQVVDRGPAAIVIDSVRQRLALRHSAVAEGHFRPGAGQTLTDG